MTHLAMVAVEFKLDWNGTAYESACRRATVQGMREAVRIIKPAFKRLAPRAGVHRVQHSYPSGWSGAEPLRITQNVIGRVFNKKTGPVLGVIKTPVGYGVFQNYGHEIVTRNGQIKGHVAGKHFAERSLIENAPRVIEALVQEWPK